MKISKKKRKHAKRNKLIRRLKKLIHRCEKRIEEQLKMSRFVENWRRKIASYQNCLTELENIHHTKDSTPAKIPKLSEDQLKKLIHRYEKCIEKDDKYRPLVIEKLQRTLKVHQESLKKLEI